MWKSAAQYRTSTETRRQLACWLSCGGRRCPVGILQVGPTGGSLALPAENPDGLIAPLHQASRRGLALVIASSRLSAPLHLPLSIQQYVSSDGALILSVSFPVEDRPEGLDEKLRVAFERRRALRVSPDPTEPVTVVLRADTGRVVGRGVLRDLSVTGLGILVPQRLGQRLHQHDRLTLAFCLPGQDTTLECAADVRFLRTDRLPGRANEDGPEVFNLGLEFDIEAAQRRGFAAPLARWLTARQIENEVGKLPHEVDDPWVASEGKAA